MRVKLVDPMPLHPSLCYPGTNRPLRALGLSADGSPLWPLCGGDGEEGGAEEDEGSDKEDPEEGEDADDVDDDDSSKKGKSKKSGPVSRDEFEALTRRLSAADKRRAEAERTAAALQAEKDEQERKGKPELENVKKDLANITKEHDTLKGRYEKLALTNAFLIASQQEGITWHNPKVAQNAGEFADLEIDEDGNVDGIRQAVKDLAKKHKYLVNTGTGDDEDGEEVKPKPRSGSGVGSTKTSKGKKDTGKLSDEELKRRFPALGRTR